MAREPGREPLPGDEERGLRAVHEPEHKFGEAPSPSVLKFNRIVNYIFVIIESLIGLRLLLKVLGGNPGNGFVAFVYNITQPFVYPFQSAFSWQTADTGIGVLEFGSLLAIAFFVLLNYAIVKLIWILSSRE